jgi:chromosome segregation ATPase
MASPTPTLEPSSHPQPQEELTLKTLNNKARQKKSEIQHERNEILKLLIELIHISEQKTAEFRARLRAFATGIQDPISRNPILERQIVETEEEVERKKEVVGEYRAELEVLETRIRACGLLVDPDHGS